MIYEIIQNIENHCKRNQMRDVFFSEEEIADPDVWIHGREPKASLIQREELPGGIRYTTVTAGMQTIYELTAVD